MTLMTVMVKARKLNLQLNIIFVGQFYQTVKEEINGFLNTFGTANL